MTKESKQILMSPVFLSGLGVLLLNDFFLKQQFHNFLTGKLSDFAGLLVFSLFCKALWPRLKLSICLFVATAFVFWKSPYSRDFIEWWNSLSLFSVGRTVDYTDLLALIILPFSYIYEGRQRHSTSRFAVGVISGLSLFAFTATSYNFEHPYGNRYYFEVSKKGLLDRIERLHEIDYSSPNPTPENQADKFEVDFDSCNAEASITVSSAEGKSIITLDTMNYRCPRGADKKEELQQFFEREVIDKLKELQPPRSAMIKRILFVPPRFESASPSPSLTPLASPTRRR